MFVLFYFNQKANDQLCLIAVSHQKNFASNRNLLKFTLLCSLWNTHVLCLILEQSR